MKLAYGPFRQLLWLIAVTTVAIVPLTAAEPPKRDTGGPCPPDWGSGFEGAGLAGSLNPGRALAVFDDGTGAAIFVGGRFKTAGGTVANNIARWDGSAWSSLGSGVDGQVLTLVVFDDGNGPALYAGGEFLTAGGIGANRVARWDGSHWSSVGDGMDDDVYALTVFDDGSGIGPVLFAAGYFTTADQTEVNHIAKWNGSTWSSVGNGTSHVVFHLAVFDDRSGAGPALYAGGEFTHAGGLPVAHIAKWNGSRWSSVGGGISATVFALGVHDDGTGEALYAGGYFDFAGGVAARHIARWDGSTWSALGQGVTGWVFTMTSFDSGSGGGPALYVGGDFNVAGGLHTEGIARWDGAQWSQLDGGTDGRVFAITPYDDGAGHEPVLYVGGDFAIPGVAGTKNIAKWDGSDWLALDPQSGSGMNDGVRSLLSFDGLGGPALYAGGDFTFAGTAFVNRIASWDGHNWSPLGGGSDYRVEALAVYDDGSGPALYAGGVFDTPGGDRARGMGKWNGVHWSALGSGVNGQVRALTTFSDSPGSEPVLYVAGEFTSAGEADVNNIAKWDGETWSDVGGGFDDDVWALAVFDDGSGWGPALFAGGRFETAGGVYAEGIAKWDGYAWSPVGSRFTAKLFAMTVFDDGSGAGPALYVGGYCDFGLSGEPDFWYRTVARWDGSLWSPVGNHLIFNPNVLVVHDDGCGGGPALYVGGDFWQQPYNYVARLDGSTWVPLSTGVNGLVLALASFDDGAGCGPALYAGGFFTTAGGRASAYIAKWSTSPPQAGACCDLLTGACVNSFASLCDGYLEVFTPAVSCAEVQCTQAENVPTISQWAMVVLGALLLIGLTLKFGRHRAVA